jgi:hypothetical protein
MPDNNCTHYWILEEARPALPVIPILRRHTSIHNLDYMLEPSSFNFDFKPNSNGYCKKCGLRKEFKPEHTLDTMRSWSR